MPAPSLAVYWVTLSPDCRSWAPAARDLPDDNGDRCDLDVAQSLWSVICAAHDASHAVRCFWCNNTSVRGSFHECCGAAGLYSVADHGPRGECCGGRADLRGSICGRCTRWGSRMSTHSSCPVLPGPLFPTANNVYTGAVLRTVRERCRVSQVVNASWLWQRRVQQLI